MTTNNNYKPYTDHEVLLEYGSYAVHPLAEPFVDSDGELQNYGVFFMDTLTCEGVTTSLPHAMSMAISYDRALRSIAEEVSKDEQDETEQVH